MTTYMKHLDKWLSIVEAINKREPILIPFEQNDKKNPLKLPIKFSNKYHSDERSSCKCGGIKLFSIENGTLICNKCGICYYEVFNL